MAEIVNTQIIDVHGLVNGFENIPVFVEPSNFDVMKLHAISNSLSAQADGIFLLWCSLTQSFIASIATFEIFTHSLNIEVKIQNSPSPVSFKLFFMALDGSITPATDGILALTLSFVKYKQN